MKRALRYLIGVIWLSVLAFVPVRISVTLIGNLLAFALDQNLPLGSAWVNWLCGGLGVICAMVYIIVRYRYDFVRKTN